MSTENNIETTGKTFKVAVVGVGRMGKHHARTYKQMAQANLVGIVDHDFERAQIVADEYGSTAYRTLEDLLAAEPDLQGVSVAVPTIYHDVVAIPLLEKKIACLVEKPLAATEKIARKLNKLALKKQVILQVGHTERFNPIVQAVKKMKHPARFIEASRVSPMTFRSLDVGVVMDMMIHDLDIVLSLANSPLKKVDATGVAVLGKHEDVCNARLTFKNGCVANITASRLAMKTERKMRMFSEKAYLSIDFLKREGIMIGLNDDTNASVLEDLQVQLSQGKDLSSLDYSSLVEIERLKLDRHEDDPLNDPLTGELTNFIDSIEHDLVPDVDGQAGHAAVDAAERILESIRKHKYAGLDSPRIGSDPEDIEVPEVLEEANAAE